YFAVITVGELYLSPTGLSLVSKVAPARYISALMGVWLGTSFVGNFIAGYLGSLSSKMAQQDFFLMIAAIAIAAGIVIRAFDRPLRTALRQWAGEIGAAALRQARTAGGARPHGGRTPPLRAVGSAARQNWSLALVYMEGSSFGPVADHTTRCGTGFCG